MTGAGRQTYRCRGIVRGTARGPVLRSTDGVCFYTMQPETGVVVEKGHALAGRSVAGTVLVFPTGKGSSVVQLDGLYQLVKHGVAPGALVVESLDTVLVASAVIMDIPVVSEAEPAFYEAAVDGTQVEVDAGAGRLTALCPLGSHQPPERGARTWT